MTRVPRAEETSGITYEQRLDANFEYALLEGSMHFGEPNSVHKTLRRIAKRLDELGIPYAVAGGMAMYFHGYRRFTDDVDILVTKDSLTTIHEELDGRGYLPPFAGSKNLRDTEHGVKIKFLISGNYPGDGKPKPVVFPDPAATRIENRRHLISQSPDAHRIETDIRHAAASFARPSLMCRNSFANFACRLTSQSNSILMCGNRLCTCGMQ